jgi:hypothetical protein
VACCGVAWRGVAWHGVLHDAAWPCWDMCSGDSSGSGSKSVRWMDLEAGEEGEEGEGELRRDAATGLVRPSYKIGRASRPTRPPVLRRTG